MQRAKKKVKQSKFTARYRSNAHSKKISYSVNKLIVLVFSCINKFVLNNKVLQYTTSTLIFLYLLEQVFSATGHPRNFFIQYTLCDKTVLLCRFNCDIHLFWLALFCSYLIKLFPVSISNTKHKCLFYQINCVIKLYLKSQYNK